MRHGPYPEEAYNLRETPKYAKPIKESLNAKNEVNTTGGFCGRTDLGSSPSSTMMLANLFTPLGSRFLIHKVEIIPHSSGYGVNSVCRHEKSLIWSLRYSRCLVEGN